MYRRSVRARGRSYSSPRRFGRKIIPLRKPSKSGVWQRGNFSLHFSSTLADQNAPENSVVVLAMIDDHLGDSANAAGRLATNMVKSLDIGGIVFNYDLYWIRVGNAGSQPASVGMQSLLLVSDRLDEEGNPTSIDCNWDNNTTPVPVASSTEIQDEDSRFPTRVHWRTGYSQAAGNGQFFNATGDYRVTDQVRTTSGRANLRLRLALDDEHCLAFHWFRNLVAFAENESDGLSCRMDVQGSLYYKTRF